MEKVISQKLIRATAKKQDLLTDVAEFGLKYLSHYFQDKNINPVLTEDLVKKHTKSFQKMVGLKQDGILDPQVIKMMEHLPRCGCPDYRTQAVGGAAVKWNTTKPITYFIEKYVDGLPKDDQVQLVGMAFQNWMTVANITLVPTTSRNNANIIISTGRGQGDQFDGPGNTLAWAYLPNSPNFNGQLLMRFDLDEKWITNATDRGILYLNVATHEFGHLLGLEHSQMPSALMAPYYSVAITKPQANDDIPRIQALYGIAVGPVTPPVPPIPPVTPPVTPGKKVKIELMVNSLADVKVDGKSLQDFSLI